MFTGIVTDIGQVKELRLVPGHDARLVVATSYDTSGIVMGASISCSGACLTAVEMGAGWFAVDASAETLSRTTLGTWKAGTRLNLERALKAGDELGGHLVSGHVDGTATVTEHREEGGSLRLLFELDGDLGRFIAPKGSVALDGVSLTINDVQDGPGTTRFGINLIPHTRTVTTLGGLVSGNRVNVEVDVMARYVARLKDRDPDVR